MVTRAIWPEAVRTTLNRMMSEADTSPEPDLITGKCRGAICVLGGGIPGDFSGGG